MAEWIHCSFWHDLCGFQGQLEEIPQVFCILVQDVPSPLNLYFFSLLLRFVMHNKLVFLSFFLTISISISICNAQQTSSSKPKSLIVPISKDSSTRQYIAHLNLGTPSLKKLLVLDLGGQGLWMDCSHEYRSSTYKPALCGSAACSVSKANCNGVCFSAPKPECNNNSCLVLTENTVRGSFGVSQITLDTISLKTRDGSKTGPLVPIPNYIFACDDANFGLLELAPGPNGMFGLSRNQIAAPSQISSAFGGAFRRTFAVCLPSTPKSNGVLFFGNSPYVFYPSYNTSKTTDVSYRFQHTKLYNHYVRTASPRVQGVISPEYFVKIAQIWVEKKPISINTTLLEFQRTGFGGSKISTVVPFGVLDSSIYRSLVTEIEKEFVVRNVTKTAPLAPFTDCYTRGFIGQTGLGLGVPDIAFVFENNVHWEMYGANTMVEMGKDEMCFAFLDGGADVTTPIVIGAHQMQDNLLQFDLAASRLAFTSTLLWDEIDCSNFKF